MHRFLCIAAALLLASSVAAEEPIFRLEEVREGQTGYGLSVFSGFEAERFEVEVLGVWSNVRPGTSYILARLAGKGLEASGVIAGMSGSPVYLDGRLAGAVAFSWPFAREPIAGITPIEFMREIGGSATAGEERSAVSTVPRLDALVRSPLESEVLVEQLALLRPRTFAGAASGVQWLATGFGESSRELLAAGLGAVVPAGASQSNEASSLLPGSAVAGLLVDGDLKLAATGTVTDRLGDELLAFGHGFLGLGSARFPMASAEIVTVIPNHASSFKVSNVGDAVGAFLYDHGTGIRGTLGEWAPTTPVELTIGGSPPQHVSVTVADLPTITPSLIAISVAGALDANTGSAGSQGVDLDADFDLGPLGHLRMRQSFDGNGAGVQAALYLFAVSGYLMQNPLAKVDVASLQVALEHSQRPRTVRLVGAHAARTLVRPGEKVPLHLDLVAYRGDPFRRSLEIEIPTGLPDGRYSLLVGDGMSADAARLSLEGADPFNLRQALELLGSLHSRREVVVLGVYGGKGLSVAGETLPELPGSIRSIWAAAASGSAKALPFTVSQIAGIELDAPVEGIVRIDLELERREPLSASPPEGGPGPAGRRGGSSGTPTSSSEKKPPGSGV